MDKIIKGREVAAIMTTNITKFDLVNFAFVPLSDEDGAGEEDSSGDLEDSEESLDDDADLPKGNDDDEEEDESGFVG